MLDLCEKNFLTITVCHTSNTFSCFGAIVKIFLLRDFPIYDVYVLHNFQIYPISKLYCANRSCEIVQPSLRNFKVVQPSLHDFEIALHKLEIAKLHSATPEVDVYTVNLKIFVYKIFVIKIFV